MILFVEITQKGNNLKRDEIYKVLLSWVIYLILLFYLFIMLYTHLPIFKDLYEVTTKMLKITQRFHKWYRYTLWEKINNTCLDLLTYIFQAQSRQWSKLDHIMTMRVFHEQLTLLVRLSQDLWQLSSKDYVILLPLLDSIWKQLTSRHKKVRS